jgi:cytoskeleton protein RodZ
MTVEFERPDDGPADGLDGPALAGALLRQARQRSGRSVDDCASALRARSVQIEAMERGDLRDFGGEIYARGFLRSYARLVGVDAQEVLRLHGEDPTYRGPVLPPREPLRIRRDPPGWLVGLVGLVVVAGVIVAVLGLGGSRVPTAVAPSDPVLDAPADPAPSPPPAAPEPVAPQPEPEPVPTGPPVDVVLTFEAASWLEVVVDGVAVETGALVPAGETLRFAGQELVALRFGNAGGVRIELNGEELGPAGRPGQVLRVTLSPDGPVDASAAAGG